MITGYCGRICTFSTADPRPVLLFCSASPPHFSCLFVRLSQMLRPQTPPRCSLQQQRRVVLECSRKDPRGSSVAAFLFTSHLNGSSESPSLSGRDSCSSCGLGVFVGLKQLLSEGDAVRMIYSILRSLHHFRLLVYVGGIHGADMDFQSSQTWFLLTC